MQDLTQIRRLLQGFGAVFPYLLDVPRPPDVVAGRSFVRPEYRRNGLGRQLLKALAALAVERDCGRFEWAVLDWNVSAIDFYESLGAAVLPDWRIARVTGERVAAARRRREHPTEKGALMFDQPAVDLGESVRGLDADFWSLRFVEETCASFSVRRNAAAVAVNTDRGVMATVYAGGGYGYAATADASPRGARSCSAPPHGRATAALRADGFANAAATRVARRVRVAVASTPRCRRAATGTTILQRESQRGRLRLRASSTGKRRRRAAPRRSAC